MPLRIILLPDLPVDRCFFSMNLVWNSSILTIRWFAQIALSFCFKRHSLCYIKFWVYNMFVSNILNDVHLAVFATFFTTEGCASSEWGADFEGPAVERDHGRSGPFGVPGTVVWESMTGRFKNSTSSWSSKMWNNTVGFRTSNLFAPTNIFFVGRCFFSLWTVFFFFFKTTTRY